MSYAPKMRMDFAYSFIIFKIAFKREIKKKRIGADFRLY